MFVGRKSDLCRKHTSIKCPVDLFYFYTVKSGFLPMFRGIFNTGLTAFPDLNSIHSDDPNFIL